MDGENNGKPYEQMDDLGGKNPYFWFNTQFAPEICAGGPPKGQWLFLVPLKGGRDYYFLPQLAGKIPLIYHL